METTKERIRNASDLACIPGITVRDVRKYLITGELPKEVSTGDLALDRLVLNLPVFSDD